MFRRGQVRKTTFPADRGSDRVDMVHHDLAGRGIRDERVLAALKTALRRESVQTRLAIAGIVLCADLPAPVNDIVEIIQRVREGR